MNIELIRLLEQPRPFHQIIFDNLHGMYDNPLIWLFIWLIIADIATGFVKSIVAKNTNSTKGINGLIKHGLVLFVGLSVYPIITASGFASAADSFIVFCNLFYAVSFIENWGQIGLPLPEWLKKYIYKLSDEYKIKHEGDK